MSVGRGALRRLAGILTLTVLLPLAVPAPAPGQEPLTPNWEAACADGSRVDLHSRLAEGPVLVSFWALWCKPCLKELQHLDRLAQDYPGRLTVLAVNIDSQRSVAKVAPYLHGKGYALTVPLDTGGDIGRLMQVGDSVPFLVLLDGQGREVYRHRGYKEGDEILLRRQVEALLERPAPGPAADEAGAAERVAAADQLEYSYSTESEREIVENWLDVSYGFGGFRTGLQLNARQPAEEGTRENRISRRFFEFSSGGFDVRAGHFYGLFGRGLLLAAYADRTIRVDTALDGVLVATRRGRLRVRAFTGTPGALDLDVRGLDSEVDLGRGLLVGGSGLTWLAPAPAGRVNREWVAALRLAKTFAWGDCYLEHGWKRGYDFETVVDDRRQAGRAFYGSLNLFAGPFALALEAKDYDRFAVLRRADGKVALNNPPALTREYAYTLLSRNTHNLDADDEVGGQAELTWQGPAGWSALAAADRTEDQAGNLLFAEAYGQLERAAPGRWRLRGAAGYQDVSREQKGWNRFFVAEASRHLDSRRTLTLQVEQQHTRLGPRAQPQLGGILHPGAFDVVLVSVEFAAAPHWTAATVLETSNKILPEQQTEPGEREGPFLAATASYATTGGGLLALWIGERQAGQVCTGGVCKREPAFAGVELYWLFRY